MYDDDVMIGEDDNQEEELPDDCILIYLDGGGAPQIAVRGRFIDYNETELTLAYAVNKLRLSQYRENQEMKKKGGRIR